MIALAGACPRKPGRCDDHGSEGQVRVLIHTRHLFISPRIATRG